jgi:hypothetical protein
VHRILVGNPKGGNLGDLGVHWDDNIKMYLRVIMFKDVEWIHVTQDRDKCRIVVNTVMNLRVP